MAKGQQFDPEFDPQEGEHPAEYEAMRAANNLEDFTPNISDVTKAKVKLLTPALKWACQAKSKTNKRDKGYFVQAVFTTEGNTVILTYDPGTAPMKPGYMRGLKVEIFGRSIEISKDGEKKVAAVFGAEVIIPRRPDASAARPQTQKPKPSPEQREKAKMLAELRKELHAAQKRAERDEYDAKSAVKVEALTRAIAKAESNDDARATELAALVKAQMADMMEATAEAETVSEEDSEILDHDDDGAEVTRSTEPWADSSTPIGATVDADCWDCPARQGARCMKAAAGEACIFA